MRRSLRAVLAAVVLIGCTTASVVVPQTAHALPDQAGAPQVTLNPGGGVLDDASDGIRYTVNADLDPGSNVQQVGEDAIYFRGTYQHYSPGAQAPMLNIGGTLYGQVSAAQGSPSWTSITVLSTSGSAAVGPRTAATGNATATLRYLVVHEGLSYVMDRTLTYTFPNDSVTETYEFTIPPGSTVPVRFYQGGDTAPGSSDSGFGVMLTSPVRSVISLNTFSGIQYGFSEVPGSKPFDGATSQSYSTPYATVIEGGDIGFVATAEQHDAGLMMQWDLGSTPGTQTASMRTFANTQGTNLTAGFDRELTTSGVPVDLDLSVVNTILTPAAGVGFTIALPAGTVVASGAQANTCGGTLTATEGATSVTLADGAVAAAANCVASVPVVAFDYGTYTLTRESVTAITNASNNVGTTSFFVPLAPAWTQTELGDLAVGTPSAAVVDADGEPAPTYAITGGALPAGLALASDTGAVTGTPTTAGSYSVTVTATNSGGTASQTFTGSVARGVPTLGGTAAPGTVEYGSPVTLEATDLPSGATGTVGFDSGATRLCTVTLPDTGCTTPTTLLPGDYPVQTSYSGDADWEPRTLATAGFTVTLATATLAADLADDTTTFGTPVEVELSVSPAEATGTLTVSGGGATWCTVVLPVASCTTPADLVPGEYAVVAAYSGDDRFTSATDPAGTLTVTRATPEPTPGTTVSTYGTAAVLTLPGLPDDATGTVTFTADGEVLCSYDPAAATGCEAPADLPSGSYDLVVTYSGDAGYEPTEDAARLVVDPAPSAVAAGPVTTTFGEPGTVAVTGVPDAATGTVTVGSGGDVLCTIDVATASSCELPATFGAGSYGLLVGYEGDANHVGSSTTTTLTVARVATELTAEPVTSTFGEPATIVVEGVAEGATGSVTVGNDELGQLCSFDVAQAGGCVTDGSTPVGSHELVVTYSGDADHEGAATGVVLQVDRVAVTVLLTAEPDPLVAGRAVTLRAVVTGPVSPSGTVEFAVDDVAVAGCEAVVVVAGEATCTTTLPAGPAALSARYSGDANAAPASSAVLDVVVEAAPAPAPPPAPAPAPAPVPAPVPAPAPAPVFAPEPDRADRSGDRLAETGAQPGPAAALGSLLTAAGALLVLLGRRRRTVG